MGEQREPLTYQEILDRLPGEDVFVIEAEMARLNKKIDTLENSFGTVTTVVLEYYNNIKVLNANSERMLMSLNTTRQPKKQQ